MMKAADGGEMNQFESPLVTIGLPVFNGAANLQVTIEAILKQSYENIELIICDNASTDGTAKIAASSAAQDMRIKFIRNNENIGAPNNFTRVLQESSGEFFMWAASGDLHSEDFIEECVGRLLENPRAALCQTRVAVCLESPDQIIYYSSLNSFIGKTRVENRYKETLSNFPAVAIYGLFRAKIAKSIPGLRNVPGGDLLWIQELSLAGDFIQSQKSLFQYIARAKWNSFESDINNLGGQPEHFKSPILRAIAMLIDRINSIRRSQTSSVSKARLIVIALEYSLKTVFVRALMKGIDRLDSEELVRVWKNKLFWRFLHNPNIEIVDKNLFQKRVINPTIGIL
jgi:glycosyltransferase involved in cell wall biosynthesis